MNPFVYVLVFFLFNEGGTILRKYPDYADHPCKRTCQKNASMECYYEFNIDRYFTNMQDCLNCSKGYEYESQCYNSECIIADGRTDKMVSVYNAQIPGPTIEICENDVIIVDIHNKLAMEVTTIHWHGIRQKGSQWLDGPNMITQCPIIHSNLFRYKFSPKGEFGTYFYHSHVGSQRSDGAFGKLIIRQPDEENVFKNKSNSTYKNFYDFDLTEHVITLTDWLYNTTEYHFYKYNRQKILFTDATAALLIDGFGCSSENTVPCKKYNVTKGSRYRFRFIHVGNLPCPITVTIEDHPFEVIATDGTDIHPVKVDRITLNNGERIDVVIDANKTPKKYKIQVTGDEFCKAVNTTAILNYKDSPNNNITKENITNSSTLEFTCQDPETPNCVTLNQVKAINPIEKEMMEKPFKYFLAIDLVKTAEPRFQGVGDEVLATIMINNISFVPQPTPLIFGEFDIKKDTCNRENFCDPKFPYCSCTHLLEIPPTHKGPVELIYVNIASFATESHPMHLHGYSFRVLGIDKVGNSTSVEEIRKLDDENKLIRNFDSPVIKDTVNVPYGGYAIIRFMPDNPGYWILHCHIDVHMNAGMAMVIKVGDGVEVPKKFPHCGNYYG